MHELTHLSLFSGIGGLDIAAEWAGFRTVGQCEWADYPHAVLQKHWPDVPKWRDIRTLTKEGFRERTGLDTVTVVSGGFPCQPFSTAGKRRGKEDDRYLWPEMLRVVSEIRPAWVVGENVAGLISMDLDTVLSDLEGIGYTCQTLVIPACAVDAPHRRDRCAILCFDTHREYEKTVREVCGRQDTYTGGICAAVAYADGPMPSDPLRAWGGQPGFANIGRWPAEPNVGRSNDGISLWLDYIGGLSDEAKRRAREILQHLRKGAYQKAVQWAAGRFIGISETEILLAGLCECEELCDRGGLSMESETIQEREVRNLWRTIEAARASYRRRYQSQPAREYSDALLRLSHGAPSLMPQAWADGTWEDGIERIGSGIINRVDRLRCLGNAVVPQQFHPIFRAIAEIERRLHENQ